MTVKSPDRKTDRIDLNRRNFLRQWPDTKPVEQCRPEEGSCQRIKLNHKTQEICAACYSPTYWWTTRKVCPGFKPRLN